MQGHHRGRRGRRGLDRIYRINQNRILKIPWQAVVPRDCGAQAAVHFVEIPPWRAVTYFSKGEPRIARMSRIAEAEVISNL